MIVEITNLPDKWENLSIQVELYQEKDNLEYITGGESHTVIVDKKDISGQVEVWQKEEQFPDN